MLHTYEGGAPALDAAFIHFTSLVPDEAAAIRYLEQVRWPSGPTCPKCGSADVRRGNTRGRRPDWYCPSCVRRFSVTAGTVLESSKIPLRTWLIAYHLMASSKKGISGADVSLVRLDIGRRLGVDPATSPTVAIGGVGRQRVVGFRVPATVRIGDSAADLNLAVPVGTLDPSGRFVAFEQRRNLIGHDFLQATGAKLDFSRPHSHAFVEVDDVELLRITAEEDRALRAWARLNLRRAARKMGSGGARRKRGGPRHVYRRAAER